MNKDKLFDEWVDLNNVACAWRSRFMDLRVKFLGVRSREEAEKVLREEEYDKRYPLLPKWLR